MQVRKAESNKEFEPLGQRVGRHLHTKRHAQHRNLQSQSQQNQDLARLSTLPQIDRTLPPQKLNRKSTRHQILAKSLTFEGVVALGQSHLPALKLPSIHCENAAKFSQTR